jgi:hypothetical protein
MAWNELSPKEVHKEWELGATNYDTWSEGKRKEKENIMIKSYNSAKLHVK